MLIVFRKSDGTVGSISGTNSLLPDGPPFEDEVQNAVNAYGGVPADWGGYRLNDIADAPAVRSILEAGSVSVAVDAQGNATLVIYPHLSAAALPNPASVNATVTVAAILPAGSLDTQVGFQVQGGTPYVEPVNNMQASHSFAFATAGTYQVAISSDHNGVVYVGVTVQ